MEETGPFASQKPLQKEKDHEWLPPCIPYLLFHMAPLWYCNLEVAMKYLLFILLCTPDLTKCIAGKSPVIYTEEVLCNMDKIAQVNAFLMGAPAEITSLKIKALCIGFSLSEE